MPGQDRDKAEFVQALSRQWRQTILSSDERIHRISIGETLLDQNRIMRVRPEKLEAGRANRANQGKSFNKPLHGTRASVACAAKTMTTKFAAQQNQQSEVNSASGNHVDPKQANEKGSAIEPCIAAEDVSLLMGSRLRHWS
jgi:hypothetical protein